MKTWTMRFREVDMARFEEIRRGEKSIETRAATVKYRPIAKGDRLIFACGSERIEKAIRDVRHFDTVEAMLENLPLEKIMPDVTSIEDVKKRYASYPDYEEKIREEGILAFELSDI